jgi:hypothetical protein
MIRVQAFRPFWGDSALPIRPSRFNMPTHEFTLLLRGPLPVPEGLVEALYANTDDGLVGERDGYAYVAFQRHAPDLATAIAEAIEQVEAVLPGYAVARIEPDDLVTMSVIAERVGRTRESVRLLIAERRGPGGFPPPVARIDGRTRLWRWADVYDWFHQAMGTAPGSAPPARIISAANAALELRAARRAGLSASLRPLFETLEGQAHDRGRIRSSA